MGGGASSQAAFEQMLACTMILGEAMVQGLDPRYVRFPDMYRLYDFHIGPSKHRQQKFNGGNLILVVHSPNKDGTFQQIQMVDDDASDDEADSNQQNKDGTSPEEEADRISLYVGDDKVILDKNTLNVPNNDGWTPLHACCHVLNATEAGCTIVHELVKKKENLNLVTKRGPGSFSCGFTPLHIACSYGLEILAIELIRAGADVNTKNSVGWTPLYDACHRGYTNIVRELLKAGAKHDVICPEFALCPFPGQTPLAEAARQGFVETVKVLLEWGVDKDASNTLGWTALHEAAYHSRAQIVQQLIVYGADPLAKTSKGSLAKELTMSSEIRAMLEDIGKASSSSPKKVPGEVALDREMEQEAEKSPKKSPSKVKAHISRKEEYPLLGDLPQLTRNAPAITIRDAEEDEDGEGDHEKKDQDDQEESKEVGKKKKKHRNSKKHGKSKEVPAAFKCAMSLKPMEEPMKSPFGHVYERKVIEAWFHDFGNRCPLTGEPLTINQLIADEKLQQEIQEWKLCRKKKATDEASIESAPITAASKQEETVEKVLDADSQPAKDSDDIYDF